MSDGGVLARLNDFIAQHMSGLFDARGVLAASGGADSTAMAHMLASDGGALYKAASSGRLAIAHFDHRLRGHESAARDRENVAALCDLLGLPLIAGAWESPSATEAAARDARYAFLAAAARDGGAAYIVTGHTADDQAETVVMHVVRGAGLHGLAGMTPVARLPGATGVRIARPLLCVGRAEARAWCASHALAFADDASNEDRAFLRNRVRHEWLPAIEARAPGARDALLRLAAEARATVDALDPVASTAIIDAGARHVTLSRDGLRSLGGVALYAWRGALVRLLGDACEFDRRHFAMLAATADAHAGTTMMLPRGVIATVDAREITLSLGALSEPAINASFSAPLPFAGDIGAWQLRAERADADEAIAIPRDAVVRARRPGDRIRPRGLGGTKKLQDYYVDRKVPRRSRDAAPVIASGASVHWTPFGAAEPAAGGDAYIIRAARIATSP